MRQPFGLIESDHRIEGAAMPCCVEKCASIAPFDLPRTRQVRATASLAKPPRRECHDLMILHESRRGLQTRLSALRRWRSRPTRSGQGFCSR